MMVRRRALYAGFGRRVRCTSSLNTRLPKISVALEAATLEGPDSVTAQSLIALIASRDAAEPISVLSQMQGVCHPPGKRSIRREV